MFYTKRRTTISNSALQAIKGFIQTQNKNMFWNPVRAFWENSNLDKCGQKLLSGNTGSTMKVNKVDSVARSNLILKYPNLKEPSQICFGFQWIPRRPRRLN